MVVFLVPFLAVLKERNRREKKIKYENIKKQCFHLAIQSPPSSPADSNKGGMGIKIQHRTTPYLLVTVVARVLVAFAAAAALAPFFALLLIQEKYTVK